MIGKAGGGRPRPDDDDRLADLPDPAEVSMIAAVSGKPIADVARRMVEEREALLRAHREGWRLGPAGKWLRPWGMLALLAIILAVAAAFLLFRA